MRQTKRSETSSTSRPSFVILSPTEPAPPVVKDVEAFIETAKRVAEGEATEPH